MRILVIDDEKNIRRTMAMAIESMEHDVVCVASGAEAFKELRSVAFQVVFLDLKLHQENGLEILEEILRLAPRVAVVVVTAFASIETAVEATVHWRAVAWCMVSHMVAAARVRNKLVSRFSTAVMRICPIA